VDVGNISIKTEPPGSGYSVPRLRAARGQATPIALHAGGRQIRVAGQAYRRCVCRHGGRSLLTAGSLAESRSAARIATRSTHLSG
jgi:hypothetical protein